MKATKRIYRSARFSMLRISIYCLFLLVVFLLLSCVYQIENADYIVIRAGELSSKGKTDEAINLLNLAIEKKDHPAYHEILGGIFYNKKMYNDALSEFEKAINMQPSQIRYICRAQAYEKIGNLSSAIDDYKQAYNLMPEGNHFFGDQVGNVWSKNSVNEKIAKLEKQSFGEEKPLVDSKQKIEKSQYVKFFVQNQNEANQSSNNSIAIIIGNRNYEQQKQGVPNVNYAHNDADLMKRYVVEGLGYREGNVIDLRDASQANLVSVFGTKDNPRGKLFDWIRPGESEVFVYYSGHGAPSLNDGKGYLLPVDADPQRIDLVGYPLETLYANLGKIPAKSITVVIDACFSGSSQAGMVLKSASPAMLKVTEAKADLPNATIITAARVSEVASWDEDAKQGLLTRYFLDGVTGKADAASFGNGDGKVTLGELKKYLESEVTYMARRLYGREQHPQVTGEEDKVLSSLN